MNSRNRFASICLAALALAPLPDFAATTNDAIARATAAIQAAMPRAQADPAHPTFHVTAPAQWINDPNGPIYYQGYYHLFYQLHPFSDDSGPKYWGHVRSRDLAKWEPLPIALWPSRERGETEIWSGCCTINGLGQPMAFYTSITAGKSPGNYAEQWAAVSDDSLMTWRKLPENPVLSESLNDGKKIYDWRDPFIFHHKKQTFLVTGGNLNEAKGGQATVNIYEAENPELTKWKYRGVLFTIPDPKARTAECPNFFQLGDRWVLFVSPYGNVQYFVGDFDPATCRFQPRTHGVVDAGPNFYAPNTMLVPDGRRIVWGWVTGFPRGHGWNGCLTIPRLLSLSRDGDLRQSPAPQLAKLRGAKTEWRNLPLGANGQGFDLPKTNALEIRAEIELGTADELVFELTGGTLGARPVVMNLTRSEVKMGNGKFPLSLPAKGGKVDCRIFLDHSVIEVFVNDTACFTKTVPALGVSPMLKISAPLGEARLRSIQEWPMKMIW